MIITETFRLFPRDAIDAFSFFFTSKDIWNKCHRITPGFDIRVKIS